jgi:hypothetical protein
MFAGIVHRFFVDRLMAADALSGGHRSVDIPLLREIAVAAEAGFFLDGGLGCTESDAKAKSDSGQDHQPCL